MLFLIKGEYSGQQTKEQSKLTKSMGYRIGDTTKLNIIPNPV